MVLCPFCFQWPLQELHFPVDHNTQTKAWKTPDRTPRPETWFTIHISVKKKSIKVRKSSGELNRPDGKGPNLHRCCLVQLYHYLIISYTLIFFIIIRRRRRGRGRIQTRHQFVFRNCPNIYKTATSTLDALEQVFSCPTGSFAVLNAQLYLYHNGSQSGKRAQTNPAEHRSLSSS